MYPTTAHRSSLLPFALADCFFFFLFSSLSMSLVRAPSTGQEIALEKYHFRMKANHGLPLCRQSGTGPFIFFFIKSEEQQTTDIWIA
jgi:hypothetical protein